jgi:hypothetical protein
MKQHDREMIGNTDTAGREITFKSEPAFTVKSRYGKYSATFDLEKNQKALFDTNRKCKFVGLIGYIPRDQQVVRHGEKNVVSVCRKIILLHVVRKKNLRIRRQL